MDDDILTLSVPKIKFTLRGKEWEMEAEGSNSLFAVVVALLNLEDERVDRTFRELKVSVHDRDRQLWPEEVDDG